MTLTIAMLIGLVRLALIFTFLFYINKNVLGYSYPKDLFSYLIIRWVHLGSIVVLLIFLLIHINAYDFFTFLIIITGFILFYFFEIKSFKTLTEDIKEKVRNVFIFIIRRKELGDKSIQSNELNKEKQDNKGSKVFIIVIVMIVLVLISRYIFYSYDIFLLSDLWIAKLEKVKAMSDQQWFTGYLATSGEPALINFYGKLVGISPMLALQSFGILESVFVAIVMYWFVANISRSYIVVPIIAVFIYIFFPLFLPLNINTLFEHKPILLALSFGLPAMLFVIKPNLLSENYTKYFVSMLLVFIAISFIDFFTSIVLLLPYLALAFFFFQKDFKKQYTLAIGAYLLALAIVGTIYAIAGHKFNIGFESMLLANLLSVSNFTYLPNLILPYDTLLNVYQGISLSSVGCIVFLRRDRSSWFHALLVIVYFNVLVLLRQLDIIYLDKDLLNVALSVFIPIVMGVSFSLVYHSIKKYIYGRNPDFKLRYRYGAMALFVLAALAFFKGRTSFDTENSPPGVDKVHARAVLGTYEEISRDYLPYTYSVVNGYPSFAISIHRHYHMPYREFTTKYLDKDATYFRNREDNKFIKNHPEAVLPASILVFYHDRALIHQYDTRFGTEEDMKKVSETLSVLKERGRKIREVYERKGIKVYEIENEPKSSRINDLIMH